jgi:hypothetical protein
LELPHNSRRVLHTWSSALKTCGMRTYTAPTPRACHIHTGLAVLTTHRPSRIFDPSPLQDYVHSSIAGQFITDQSDINKMSVTQKPVTRGNSKGPSFPIKSYISYVPLSQRSERTIFQQSRCNREMEPAFSVMLPPRFVPYAATVSSRQPGRMHSLVLNGFPQCRKYAAQLR